MNADKSLAMVGLPKTDSDLTAKGEDSIVQAYISTMRKLDSDWLDAEANEYWRQAGSICYTEAEFRASEQGRATADDGLYLLQQFDKDTLPPVPYSLVQTDEQARTARPLHGLKLLDISRVIAAPTIAKLAALFGATVIRVSCASQPDMGPLLVDGNLGKRDVSLDLKSDDGRETLRRLVADADIVLDGYRPGALERLGFGVAYLHTLARRRGRGIVVVRENCYGWHGPWAHRAGWQQISDCVTGVAWAMGRFLDLDEPVVPPLPNSDYQTGLAGLIGIMAAVDRRATEGGSYTVDVSLNQYNQFLLQLGAHTPAVQRHLRALHPQFGPRHFDDMTRLTGKVLRSMYGSVPQLFKPEYFSHIVSNLSGDDGTPETLTYVLSAATYDATRLGYDVGSCFLGAYAPEWP
ncbi:caib baif family enzyme [Grosmannia clavigera kw1407]|uniref:Caib baif family enzyme n=1 Tax=Grosmannia clavigera (strain kw1407 / UAMH 11150) TaxID=655863 RepID=F0XNL6_GROCL|nr:caib baif family enzyme [Grosmannia clavigera kw1407]EFX00417.1 caib baif family enzyme [Grosmannia clavigera kw1407]